MRRVWSLPCDQLLVNSGKEWLLHLLINCNDAERGRVLMLIWRIWQLWQLRNDLTHDKEVPPVAATVDYLESYMKSIGDASKYSTEEIIKGKMPVAGWTLPEVSVVAAPKVWLPPPTDYVAPSVDGSFSGESSAAAAGMILRHNNGLVIFATYRFIFNCNDALEVKIHALMQGMALAIQHSNCPVIVQSDSSVALSSLT